jgi:beta-glucanase (GH16 family)
LDLDDGFASLDGGTWRVRDHQAYSRDAATVLAANVSVHGGVLRVQAKQESVGGRAYTSGDLDTYGRYSLPNYFRAEVRAKVPFEQGMWAAPLWIRPADGSSGEIDLIETYGSQASRPIIHQTIHTAYGAAHQQTHLQTPYATVGGSALDWHTYVVEKLPGRITMYVDGVKTAEFNKANSPWFDTYYEAGKRWSLRMSLQVGGGQGLPDSSTDWAPDKTAMQIDYVRTWVRG